MPDADRVVIAIQEISAGGTDADIAFTAADSVNGHYFLNDGKCVLLMSSSAGSKTATVKSVANRNGRTGDITLAPAGGKIGAVGLLKPGLYNQTSALYLGRVFVDIDVATGVTFAVVKFA